ncbi:MAG: cytochrome c biogenesis protein ResB [Janthinobacterium lividum]
MSVTSAPVGPAGGRGVRRALVELLGSMRFAISMLVVLAIASIIGTVLKQDDPYPNYVNQFGPFWADIFRSLSLYTVYSAWWFMLILGFLLVSVSICVIRNGPKMIAEARSWKDRIREGGLRAFGHKAEYAVSFPRQNVAAVLISTLAQTGYRTVQREHAGATLIAGKRGAFNRIGYIFAHVAIVVICIGGLLDSNLPIRLQMWMFHKTSIHDNQPIAQIGDEHRLSTGNPTFRGYAWVPEGQHVSTAILNQQDGTLVQNLPFSIQLNKFIVDYYSTGMPKLFASDIVVIDHATGARVPARVEVNEPFTYDGVSIYQSSFEDGGSTLSLTAYPMTGAATQTFPLSGQIGGTATLPGLKPGEKSGQTIEFSDFRAINVENIVDASGKSDVRGVGRNAIKEAFEERLGSGAKSSTPRDLHNIGPSFQYKVRNPDGQALEYNTYMLPATIDGQRFFLAGMRADPDGAFRYLRIPVDDDGTVRQWMLLRAALHDPALRARAAASFAARSVGPQDASLRPRLQESAQRVLDLFAGSGADPAHPDAPADAGGFAAVAGFIDHSVPKADQEKAAALLLRMLEGSMWDLWQIARTQASQPALADDPSRIRFIEASINALSDSFFYGAPVLLQLDSFKQVQASVFQLTRAPGKKIVYLGSLLLVIGIFSMFFIRERRVWFWLKDEPAQPGSEPATTRDAALPAVDEPRTSVLMAMSTARKTLDFDREFAELRDRVGAVLTANPGEPPDAAQ